MVPENTSISKADALAEAYKRGLLPPDKKAAYEEAMKRGLVQPAAAIATPAPMSQPDATPWGDGQAFDDMYARKPQTDPMLSPLMPGARTLTSGQPTRLKPPPAPRGPVMSPAQRMATQPERDQAGRVRKYNEELALMNAASPIPFKNTGPDGPLELNQERPDQFAGRALGSYINTNIGAANTLGQLGLNTANAFGAALDPNVGGALAGMEYYRGDSDAPERLARAVEEGGYVKKSQQASNDIIPSLAIPAATTPGEMLADVTGIGASIFTGFGAPVLKGGKALSESLATVPGMSRTLRGVGVETGENAILAYGVGAGAAPPGSDRNMAGTRSAADPLNYVSIEAARAVPRALRALDAPTTPTNAGGANLRQPAPQMPPVAPAVAATQTAQQAPTQPQTATAPPVPPTPPNAPAVTAGAPQPVPARSRAEQRADDLLIKKLAADGITMDDVRKIQARLARRGDSGVYETIGEIAALTDKSSGANLRGLQMAGGAAPGPLQEALVGLVNQNTDKLSPRLSRGATRATGQKADNAVATLDELETRLRTEAAPAYDTAYATPVDPGVFANEIVPVLNTPSGQKALQAARNNLASVAADLQARAARGASERATMESQRAQAAVKSIDDFMADPVRGTAIPTTMALDYTKRAFDDVIADAGFGSDTARIVGGTKRNFADSVSQATGGQYGNALGVFEDVKRLEDAFETGLKSLSQPTWELQRAMAKGRNGSPWTAGEVEALAMGVARNIEDLIEANNQSALTKLLKDKALKNMATALGSQKAADMFEETIRRLGANREWGRRVAGGSDTAMRQAAIRDAGMEGEDAVTRVLDRVETSGNQFSLPGLVNDVAVKPIARTAKDIYQRLRYPGVYDEEVNRALIPLIGKPMTEGNLNEVIRRVEARMAEKGLIPPAQPAAVAAPPPAPRRGPRGPRGNPPGTTSSASATGTGIVAGGVLGAMAPADDENEQFINALFTAAGVGTAAGVASKLSKGGKPPPASAKGSTPKPPKGPPAPVSSTPKPPPVKNGFGGNPEAIGAGLGTVFAPDADGDGEVSFGERAGAAITGGVMGRGARAIGNRLGGAPKAPPAGKFRGPNNQTFAGVNAKTADKAALARAQNMEAEGASRDDIWDATGWFKGVDGKWRFEIDDSGASFAPLPRTPYMTELANQYARENFGVDSVIYLPSKDVRRAEAIQWATNESRKLNDAAKTQTAPLSERLNHPQLNSAYDLSGVKVGRETNQKLHGSYEPTSKMLRVADESPVLGQKHDPRETALHETQHHVQSVEDFARGGNPDAEAALMRDSSKKIAAIQTQIKSLLDGADRNTYDMWNELMLARVNGDNVRAGDINDMLAASGDTGRKLSDLLWESALLKSRTGNEADAFDAYRRLAGETEARNVQTRRDFTPEQRRAKRPWETQDVPDDQQIVRFAGGKAESRPKPPPAGNRLGKPKPPPAKGAPKPKPVEARRAAPRGNNPFRDPRLTPGENKTAEMVLNGYSYDEIADEMMTSRDVVKTQASAAQRKLGTDVQLPRPGGGKRPAGSTKREAAFELFDSGVGNAQIAERLGISVGNVRTYRSYWKQRQSAPVANVNGALYNPPSMPERPFEADYPQNDWPDGPPVDAQGRLTQDMDRKPLDPNSVVIGRNKAPGYGAGSEADRSLRDRIAIIQTLKQGGSRLEMEGRPKNQASGGWAPDFDVNGRFTGRGSAKIADDLDRPIMGLDDQEVIVLSHELAHSIDFKGGPKALRARNMADFNDRKWGIDHTGHRPEARAELESQLERIYTDLNNPVDGPVEIRSPKDHGYQAIDADRELWAEAIRAYMYDPNYIKTVAPEVAFMIRDHVNRSKSLRKTIQFNAAPTIVGLGGLGLGAAALSAQPAEAQKR